MSALRRLLFFVACIALVAGYAVQAVASPEDDKQTTEGDTKVRTDRYGDPLPSGAIARLGTVRFRQPDGVEALAFAPDGKILASAGRESISVWDVGTGKQLLSIIAHRSTSSIAFSPDGKALVSGHWMGPTYLRDAITGRLLRKLGQDFDDDSVNSVGFSPDGKTVATGSRYGYVRLWDVRTGEKVQQFPAESAQLHLPVHMVGFSTAGEILWDNLPAAERAAYSPEGKLLALSKEGKVTVRDRRDQAHVLMVIDNITPQGILLGPDGLTLALWGTGDRMDEIALWDTKAGRHLRRIHHDSWLATAVFSPDGKTLASAGSGVIRLWDVATGKELPQSHGDWAGGTPAFAPDGRRIALAAASTTGIWDIADQVPLRIVPSLADTNSLVTFVHGGKEVVSPHAEPAANGTVQRGLWWWNVATGAEVARMPGIAPHALLAISADCKALAMASESGIIELWDLTGRERRRSLQGPGWPVSRQGCLALSADGNSLACGGGRDDTVYLWDVDTGKALPGIEPAPLLPVMNGKEVPRKESAQVWYLAFLPDGKTLAVGKKGEQIVLWDLHSRKPLLSFGEPLESVPVAAALSPDGKLLATTRAAAHSADRAGYRSSRDVLVLWETATGGKVGELPSSGGDMLSLAFSGDGKALASTHAAGTALIWDVLFVAQQKGAPVATALDPQALDKLWDRLAARDAAAGFRAISALVSAKDQAVTYLKGQLPPSEPIAPHHLHRLIADLSHEDFQVRDKGSSALEHVGTRAEPAVRTALAADPPAEVRRRLEAVLQALHARPLPPDRLRSSRTIQALEYIGTAKARHVLDGLANGDPLAEQTQEAHGALGRLQGAMRP